MNRQKDCNSEFLMIQPNIRTLCH